MRIAVLGLGSAGSRHARLLVEAGHEAIGFDPAGGSVPGVEVAASEQDAIAAAEAVVVASPNIAHAAQALAAIAAGRHVLVEKPLALGATAATAVADAAREAGVVCGVAMNLRFHAGIRELRRLVADGTLGRIQLATLFFGYDLRRWRPDADYRESYSARAELGGGILLDAIHELDYLQWLLGPVTSAIAEIDHVSDLEIDVEDVVTAALRLESGAVATVSLNYLEASYRRGCVLAGTRASAIWDWKAATVTVRGPDVDLVTPVPCPVEETYRAELEDFVAAVRDGGAPCTPADDGVAALRLVEAIRVSAERGERVTIDA